MIRRFMGVAAIVMLLTAAGLSTPWRPFTADSPWNLDVSTKPVDPNNAAWIAYLKAHQPANGPLLYGGNPAGDWGIAVYQAGPGDPEYNVTSTQYCLPPEAATLRIPLGAQPPGGSDHEMTIVDAQKGYVMHLWNAHFDGTSWTAGGGNVAYIASNGLDASLGGDPRNTGCFRGESPWLHISAGDVTAGSIPHALRLFLNSNTDGHIFPMAGDENGGGIIPEGARLRLKASYNISQWPLRVRVILVALKKYGAVVTDQGGNTGLQLNVSPAWQTWGITENTLTAIGWDNFEFVDA